LEVCSSKLFFVSEINDAPLYFAPNMASTCSQQRDSTKCHLCLKGNKKMMPCHHISLELEHYSDLLIVTGEVPQCHLCLKGNKKMMPCHHISLELEHYSDLLIVIGEVPQSTRKKWWKAKSLDIGSVEVCW
jgi:RNA polymerase subunit RPABC4/transcription elongation factor Spt4